MAEQCVCVRGCLCLHELDRLTGAFCKSDKNMLKINLWVLFFWSLIFSYFSDKLAEVSIWSNWESSNKIILGVIIESTEPFYLGEAVVDWGCWTAEQGGRSNPTFLDCSHCHYVLRLQRYPGEHTFSFRLPHQSLLISAWSRLKRGVSKTPAGSPPAVHLTIHLPVSDSVFCRLFPLFQLSFSLLLETPNTWYITCQVSRYLTQGWSDFPMTCADSASYQRHTAS